MKKRLKRKINLKSLILLACVFLIFYFTAKEDRLFKRWKSTNKDLFSSYFEAKTAAKAIISPGTKVLIDVSKLKDFNLPFGYNLLGNARRLFYSYLSPQLKEYSNSLNLEGPDLHLEKLSSEKKLKPYDEIPYSELEKIKKENPKGLKIFMLENEIEVFVCFYENWWRKKKELEKAKFNPLYRNKHFVLSSAKK